MKFVDVLHLSGEETEHGDSPRTVLGQSGQNAVYVSCCLLVSLALMNLGRQCINSRFSMLSLEKAQTQKLRNHPSI